MTKEHVEIVLSSPVLHCSEHTLKWLATFQPRDPSLCTFTDVACPRPDLSHACGCTLPKDASIPLDIPAWCVLSSASRVVIPDQQLHLFDPPRIEWDNKPARSKKRRWWVAWYYCKHGRDWAIINEKKLGARHVRVIEVRRKPGCKRKNVYKPFTDFCV